MSFVHISFYPIPEGVEGLFQRFHWELCGELYPWASKTLNLLAPPQERGPLSWLYYVGESLTHLGHGKYDESLGSLKPLLNEEALPSAMQSMLLFHKGFLHMLLENEGVAQKFLQEAEKTIADSMQSYLLYFLGLFLLKREDVETALKALLEARRTSSQPILKAKVTLALLSCDPLPIKEDMILSTCEEIAQELRGQLPALNPQKELALIVQLDRILSAYQPHQKNLSRVLPPALLAARRLLEFGLLDHCLHFCQRLLDLTELYVTSEAAHLIEVYALRGEAHSMKKEYERAEKDLEYAFALLQHGASPEKEPVLHLLRSITRAKQKSWKKARKDLDYFLQHPVPAWEATASREMGYHLLEGGDAEGSLSWARKSIQQAKSTLDQARSLRLEGVVALKKRDLFLASHSLRLAAEKFLDERNYLEFAATLRFVAENFALSGDFTAAHDSLDEGIALLTHYEGEADLPLFYSAKARLYLLKEQFQKAEAWGEKELELTSKVKGEILGYTLLLNARIKREKREVKVAENFLQRAHKIFSAHRNWLLQGACLLEEALLFAEQRRFSEGLRCCQQALDLYEREKHMEGEARAYYVRGRVFRTMRQMAKSKQSLQAALRLEQNVIREQHLELAEVYSELAEVCASDNEKEEAAEHLFRALDIVERAGLENWIQKYLSRLQDISPKSIAQYRLQRLTGSVFSKELLRMRNKTILKAQKLSALFIDLRGFTKLIGNCEVEQIADILHQFYTICSQASTRFGGQLNKFLGDGALFLFPEVEGESTSALQCAFFLKEQLERAFSGQTLPLDFGMALDRGEALVGIFGFGSRQDYTAIGECIVVASRLQGFASGGELILSERAFVFFEKQVQLLRKEVVAVKGIEEPLTMCIVSVRL